MDLLKDEWDEKSLSWKPVKSIVQLALEKVRDNVKSRDNDEIEKKEL